jgi:polyisoprenoid-binding protein YceI
MAACTLLQFLRPASARFRGPLLALALPMAMGPPAAVAQPVVYDFDPERSFVHFEVLHFNTSTTRGRFGPISGAVTMDRSAGSGELALRVATATVDTGLRFFDARLRQPDFLDSAAQPEAFFVARSFRFDGARLAEVRGEFTLRGVSQPLSLNALRFACRQDPQRLREVCGGDFEARLNRSEFGSTFGLPFVGDSVRLVVQVEGVRR